MKTTTIRQLKHDTTTVLSWAARGETVEVQRRGKPVAVISPVRRGKQVARPDFAGRLKGIYGEAKSATTGTHVISEARGES